MSRHSKSKPSLASSPKADALARQHGRPHQPQAEFVAPPRMRGPRSKDSGTGVAQPTAYDLSFDPLSRKFAMRATGVRPLTWPDDSEKALQRVADALFYSKRDRICWMIAAARLQGIKAKTFIARVEPVPPDVDGAEDYLYELLPTELERLNHAAALAAILGWQGEPMWLLVAAHVRFGISSKRPLGSFRTKEDCLNPLLYEVDMQQHPNLHQLARRAAKLVALIKPQLLKAPNESPERVWKLALNQFAELEQVDNRAASVVSLPQEEKARMPNDDPRKLRSTDSALAKDIEQAHRQGFESLTRPALRRLRDKAIERLKIVEQDDQVKRRAIVEDIYPLAEALFPDNIKSPKDVDPQSLTKLFRLKSEAQESAPQPLSGEELDRIRQLTQAWRKHFRNVIYQGKPASVTSAGKAGLKWRTSTEDQRYLGKSKFWPKIEFKWD